MKPADCPFRAADRLIEKIGSLAPVVIVDVHAEATSEKQLLSRYLDGRVSAVLGTHTHVATADEQILEEGNGLSNRRGDDRPAQLDPGSPVRSRVVVDADLRPCPFRRRHRRPTLERGAREHRSPDGQGALDQQGEPQPGGRATADDGVDGRTEVNLMSRGR